MRREIGWFLRSNAWCLVICLIAWSPPASVTAADSTINLAVPIPAPIEGTLGVGGKNPAGIKIDANTQFLTLDGKPWTPVMGEFHYMRYPRSDWDQEMRKMKAGGITVLSTYVIWIFHEETQGQFDWSGNKDLGAFIDACAKNGLKVALRIGPWVHSEARNGGIPDWVVEKCGRGVRSQDPQFMVFTKTFYEEIFKQVKGKFWTDGGPIVAVQIENESTNIPYLQALKQLAIGIGYDAPLYSITAWDHVRPPDSGFVPMFGGYPDGFWYDDKGIPEKARTHYFFTPIRDDSEIQTATLLPTRNSIDLTYINKFPFLTCEIGGGMAIAYSRRPLMSWQDVTASALTQFGAGSNLLGYYMYHGGAHPLGKNGQGLQEKQDSPSTNYNDLPAIHYDFQAPIGQYGQIRPVYHSLGLLHAFINDFGPELATMPSFFPDEMPESVNDIQTLRWTVRTNGKRGFIFINNYERGRDLPARNVQLDLKLRGEDLKIPTAGTQFPASSFAIWPFNMDLNGVVLKYATAQLICRIEDGGVPVFVFFSPGEIKSEFSFDDSTLSSVNAGEANAAPAGGGRRTLSPQAGTQKMITVTSKAGRSAKILLLTQAQAMRLLKADVWGAQRLILSNAELALEGDTLVATSRERGDLSVAVYPVPAKGLSAARKALTSTSEGVFTKYAASVPAKAVSLQAKKVKDAGPARQLVFGTARRPPVPTEPTDADFDTAAVWQVSVPADALGGLHEVYLKIDYTGDSGRAYVGDQFIDDDFYFGQAWEIGIKRFSPAISEKGLTIKLLPLRQDAPVYIEPNKRPPLGANGEALEVRAISAEPEYQLIIQASK